MTMTATTDAATAALDIDFSQMAAAAYQDCCYDGTVCADETTYCAPECCFDADPAVNCMETDMGCYEMTSDFRRMLEEMPTDEHHDDGTTHVDYHEFDVD
jgi:hypothetical protein